MQTQFRKRFKDTKRDRNELHYINVKQLLLVNFDFVRKLVLKIMVALN